MAIQRTLRLALDYSTKPSSMPVMIEAMKGNALDIQFGIFNGVVPYNLSGLTSVSINIRPSRNTATNLASITIAVADLEQLPNRFRWDQGTWQHGTFQFTDAQMNQSVSGEYTDYWWSAYALPTNNEEVTLGCGVFRIYESNISNAGVAPTNPGVTITLDEADARYVRFDAAETLTNAQRWQALENLGITWDNTQGGFLLNLPPSAGGTQVILVPTLVP